MNDTNTRWSLVVSRDTDTALRQFLASQGGGHKGDLSRFVEKAVRASILNSAASTNKQENTAYSAAEIDGAVEEALIWAKQ